jgi:hypothetical protein
MDYDRVSDQQQQGPDTGSKGSEDSSKSQSQAAQTPPADTSPINPKKVMEDALKAIVRNANEEAGTSGDTPAADQGVSSSNPKRKRKRKPRSSAGAAPAQGGSRGGRERSNKGGSGSAMNLAGDSMRSLSEMLKRLLDSKKVHFLRRPRYMELNLKIPVDADRDGSRCASQMVDQLLALVDAVEKNETALVPGSVYCYFHESAEAEGCRPTEPRQVFDGYGSTGRPKFTDFVTMAIERKAKGIEGLVGGDEGTLTHVTQGRVLRTAQLAEFGKASPVFRVLGQVDAGLFAVRGTDSKAAFSFQVLLGKDLQGLPVLRLHPVGMCDVMTLADQSVPQILRRFQGDLEDAVLRLRGLQSNGEQPDVEEFVFPLMQNLAKQLEDRARHRLRRTEHAENRSQKSKRPTNKAYADAQNVTDENLLWDDKESTVVVLGDHNRVHVFTVEGRHVTSLPNIGRSGVQQRLKSHRWRPTEPTERGEFRMQLRAMVKSHREESERSNIQKKAHRDKAAPSGDAPAKPGHLQAKIAGLMAGLGGGAATLPAPADVVVEAPVDAGDATSPETTVPAKPEDASAPTQGPEDASAPTQGPEDASAPTQGPEDASASTQSPEDASAPTQSPEDASAPTQGEAEAKASESTASKDT